MSDEFPAIYVLNKVTVSSITEGLNGGEKPALPRTSLEEATVANQFVWFNIDNSDKVNIDHDVPPMKGFAHFRRGQPFHMCSMEKRDNIDIEDHHIRALVAVNPYGDGLFYIRGSAYEGWRVHYKGYKGPLANAVIDSRFIQRHHSYYAKCRKGRYSPSSYEGTYLGFVAESFPMQTIEDAKLLAGHLSQEASANTGFSSEGFDNAHHPSWFGNRVGAWRRTGRYEYACLDSSVENKHELTLVAIKPLWDDMLMWNACSITPVTERSMNFGDSHLEANSMLTLAGGFAKSVAACKRGAVRALHGERSKAKSDRYINKKNRDGLSWDSPGGCPTSF